MNYQTEFDKEQLIGWFSRVMAGVTNTPVLVKNGPTKFGGYYIYNPNSTAAYIQVFDAAAAADVTLGTTTPIMSYGIPPTSGANIEFKRGRRIDLGIVIAGTATATGAGSPGTALDTTIYYM